MTYICIIALTVEVATTTHDLCLDFSDSAAILFSSFLYYCTLKVTTCKSQ